MQVPRKSDDLADILYTSGTTGRPKGVAVRHSNASMVGDVPPSWTGGGWLHASPMFTFAGIALVYTPMKLGMRGIYQPSSTPPAGWRWWPPSSRSAIFLVPAMAHLLLDDPGFETLDLSSVEHVLGGQRAAGALRGGAAAGTDARRHGVQQLRHDRGGFGLLHHAQGRGGQAPGLGRVRSPPPALVRIVNADGEPMPADEVGEVRMQLPGRQREYFGDPEATAETWRDGWLVTGDLGKLDEDGYLYIVGRSKDVIIRGGNNVHATDVEHVLVQHDAVAEVAVVGAPHPVLGEDVVAFVVLHEGADVDGEALRAYALEQLADYKVPRQFHFIDELPRNATGKVIKPELRARLADATT